MRVNPGFKLQLLRSSSLSLKSVTGKYAWEWELHRRQLGREMAWEDWGLTIPFDPEDTDMAVLEGGPIPGIFSYTSQQSFSLSLALFLCLLEVGFCHLYLKQPWLRPPPFGVLLQLDNIQFQSSCQCFNGRYVSSKLNAIHNFSNDWNKDTLNNLSHTNLQRWWTPSTILINKNNCRIGGSKGNDHLSTN